LGWWKRSKKKIEIAVNPVTVKTELEQFLADDKATYEALRNTMFLDPKKPESSSKNIAEKAKKAEKETDPIVAAQLYEIAGSLAIYEGDAEKVTEYFGKCEKLLPQRKHPILKNPEHAVAKAQEYYQKYLKT
jgi:ATP/maltotriose-dependent transcriptional regulator MalT